MCSVCVACVQRVVAFGVIDELIELFACNLYVRVGVRLTACVCVGVGGVG